MKKNNKKTCLITMKLLVFLSNVYNHSFTSLFEFISDMRKLRKPLKIIWK